MGGVAPLGYDVHEHHLVINPAEAETLKEIFRCYRELGSVRLLKEDLDRRGIHSKLRIAKNGNRSGGKPFSRGALYKLLSNPICIGEISHKGARHPGQHEAIIERELFEHIQTLLRERAVRRKIRTNKVASSPLAGKLLDESGESLIPSHAVKGERRYRYYVSRNLIAGTADPAKRGWRVPAPELERTLAAAVCQILSDQPSLAAAAQAIGLAENRLPAIFKVAEASGHRLQSEVDAAAALAALIDRVELKEFGMDVSLKLRIPAAEAQNRAIPSEVPITRLIPVQVRRRGVEMRLIIESDGAPARGTDQPLLKVVARARRWFDRLSSGRARSVAEIALREGITARYVRRLLGLAFLAPEMVEAIAGGHQPPDLTAEALSQRINLPLDWTAQMEALDLR